MTFQAGKLIQALDYNNLVGSNPSSDANKLNTVWATGNATAGYGQTALSTVTAIGPITKVTAAQWLSLINTAANIAAHQGSSFSAISPMPVQGGKINLSTSTLSNITTNLATIYANRFNASGQGTSSQTNASTSANWTTSKTFTHTVTFASSEHARFFFNSGGQLKLNFTHTDTSDTINTAIYSLCNAAGTMVMSAPGDSTQITIGGTTFNGVTAINNTTSPSLLATTKGYYGLTTSNVTVYTIYGGGYGYGYGSLQLSVSLRTNAGTTNGANGNIITLTTTISGVSATVKPTTTSRLIVQPPMSTYLPTNTWGSPTVGTSVS